MLSSIFKYFIVLRLMLFQVPSQGNEKIFYPLCIQLALLRNYPHLIPISAQWQYDDWHPNDSSYNLEQVKKNIENERMTKDVQLTLVVLKKGISSGSISLEIEARPEFVHCKGPWIENFPVIPEAKKYGIGSAMAQGLFQIAQKWAYPQGNFFSSIESHVPS